MNKKMLLAMIIVLIVLLPLSAKETITSKGGVSESGPEQNAPITPSPTRPIDLGQDQLEESLGGLLEGTAASDGSFSVSYAPDFSFNKISFQLNLTLQGNVQTDPFNLNLDFSDWELPARGEDQSRANYLMRSLGQYSSFIRYVQWGDRYEPIYIRYGKLTGITLGDGALLNGYFDLSVGAHITRPGLHVSLDGNLIRLPNAGFEFVTNDLFNSTLMAWRLFSRPFCISSPYSYFSNVEFGLSYAENPSASFVAKDPTNPHTRKLIAIDMGIPLLERDFFTLGFFTDILLQTPGSDSPKPAFATRYGISGYSKSFFLFNTSLTFPIFGNYYTDYFDSGFEDLSLQDRKDSILHLGSIRVDAMAGLNFTRLGVYVRTRIRSDYTDGSFSNHTFQANARIDKRLLNIVSLDLSYEKLYPSLTGEGFVEGLVTLRNVEIAASAIIKIKPYSFTIGLGMVFDEFAQSTLQVDTAVRISIL